MNKIQFKTRKEVSAFLKERNIDTTNWTEGKWQSISKSQAEIHIQALAEAMWDEYNGSDPKQLKPGEWHIPFSDNINDDEILQKIAKKEEVSHLETAYDIYQYYAIKIATARCARLSYMTFEGKIDYEKDIALHDQLFNSKHYSPFEHCARAMTDLEYYSFIKGEVPTYKDGDGILNYEYYPYSNGKTNRDGELWMGFIGENPNNGNRFGWCNNLRGFIQYRYLVESQKKK